MLNKYSKNVTQDPSQPAAQAMLHAIGLTDDDFKKPFIGIASTGYEGNPCNMHLNDLSSYIKTSINNSEIVGLIFNTIGVSDGISMGTLGMRYSLPSRDIIADSIETVVQGMSYDGLITVVGCGADKITKRIRGSVRIVENQIYNETNTAESMRLPFNNTLKKNHLFIHGDLYFNQETLSGLDYGKSFILIDDSGQFAEKEVGVTANKGVATILSYGLPTKWAQIVYVTGKETEILKKIFNKFDTVSKKNLSFEVINKMISMGASFQCHSPQDMSILEIDCIKDLKNESINFK